MNFGERIKELREEKGLTRQEMARSFEIDSSTYGKYELGQREPKHETVKKLADFFNVSVDYLLGRTNVRHTGEVSAASSDIPYEDLPPEAIKQLEEYKQFLIDKYGKKS